MSELNERYGYFGEDGAVTEPRFSILSGKPIFSTAGTVRERVTGTPYFYRIEASGYADVTDAQRAEWQAGIENKAEETGKGEIPPRRPAPSSELSERGDQERGE